MHRLNVMYVPIKICFRKTAFNIVYTANENNTEKWSVFLVFIVCADDTASETQLKLSRQVHETIWTQYIKTHNGLADAIAGRSNGTCGEKESAADTR